MVGAVWGVFVWKEFKQAPPGTGRLLAAMFSLCAGTRGSHRLQAMTARQGRTSIAVIGSYNT